MTATFELKDSVSIVNQATATQSSSLLAALGTPVASATARRIGRGSSLDDVRGAVKYISKAYTPLGRPWRKR
jgi:hypothetical protein